MTVILEFSSTVKVIYMYIQYSNKNEYIDTFPGSVELQLATFPGRNFFSVWKFAGWRQVVTHTPRLPAHTETAPDNL